MATLPMEATTRSRVCAATADRAAGRDARHPGHEDQKLWPMLKKYCTCDNRCTSVFSTPFVVVITLYRGGFKL